MKRIATVAALGAHPDRLGAGLPIRCCFPSATSRPPKGLISFNALKDGSMLPTIQQLLDRYDASSN
jgi:hypothetical protein